MPHPQWPQLWPQPRPFSGGSFPAQPSPSTDEEKNDGRQQRRLQEGRAKNVGSREDPDVDKNEKAQKKAKKDKKKEKKEKKKEKKEKKKKEKEAKKNPPPACAAEDGDEQAKRWGPNAMKLSDSEPGEQESSGSEASAQGAPEDKADDAAAAEDKEKAAESAPAKGDLPAEGQAETPGDSLRQALTLLKERRAELEKSEAALETAHADIDEFEVELDKVEAELEKEREVNKTLVARSLEEQSQLSLVRSELADVQKAKTALSSDVADLQLQLKQKSSDFDQCLAELDQMRQEKAGLTDGLAKVKSQLATSQADLSKSRESAAAQETVSQAQLGVARAELEESRKAESQLRAELDVERNKAKNGDVGVLQSKLKMARVDLDKARKDLSVGSNEIYSARRRQAALTEELAKARKLAVSVEARNGLSAAWESLLSLLEQQLGPDELESGFHQLGAALRSAGFWNPEGEDGAVEEKVEAKADPAVNRGDDASPISLVPVEAEEPPLARLRSDADIKSKRKSEKLEKHGKKEKKGKSSKDKRQAEEDDKEAIESMPHRTCSAGSSMLKKRRMAATASDSAASGSKRLAKLTFADSGKLVTQVTVIEYKSLKDKLWDPNPLARVQCEKCERRVPQTQGRLQGNPGVSQFMQEKFHCGDCVEPSFSARSPIGSPS